MFCQHAENRVEPRFPSLTQGAQGIHPPFNNSNQLYSLSSKLTASVGVSCPVEIKGRNMKPVRRLSLAMATVALVLYSANEARSDEQIQVLSMQSQAPVSAGPVSAVPIVEHMPGEAMHSVDAAEYRRIYKSIPFSRAEYRVNPNYRHDSTMEIMTGNSRHQTIVQHNHEHKQPVQPNPAPARPSRILTPFSGMSFFWNSPLWFNSPLWLNRVF